RPYLPSFPTRRSSDLGEVGPAEREDVGTAVGRAGHDEPAADQFLRCRAAFRVSGRRHRELELEILGEREIEEHVEGIPSERGGQDRKSTRLNSSHVAI